MSDPTLNGLSATGAYDPDPATARRAALYVAWRLGLTCGDVLDMLGLRDGRAHDKTHYRDPAGRAVVPKSIRERP